MKKILITALFLALISGNTVAYAAPSITGATQKTLAPKAEKVCAAFARTLKIGSYGSDVQALQRLLNEDSETRVAVTGAGSIGNETMYFGPATMRAVVKFQEKHRAEILTPVGLTKGTGVVGPSTRSRLVRTCTTLQPVIESISPNQGGAGTKITLTGKNFTDVESVRVKGIFEPTKVPENARYMRGTYVASVPVTERTSTSLTFVLPSEATISADAPYVNCKKTICPMTASSAMPEFALQGKLVAGNAVIEVRRFDAEGNMFSAEVSFMVRENNGVVYSVTTDKKTYAQDEKIKIFVTARNTSNSNKTLTFTSCPINYTIAQYNYLATRLCMLAVTEETLKPGQSRTWEVEHDPQEYKIPAGTRTLFAEVVGNGQAETSITITPEKNVKTPVIEKIDAPVTLKVNEQGTWSIETKDINSGRLSYYVRWGDEAMGNGATAAPASIPRPEVFVQTSTFTHAYAAAGTYTPTFYVTNDSGLTTSTSVSVKVTQ